MHQLSGLYCPGCGALRALWDLVHGNPLSAARNNILILLMGPAWTAIWVQNVVRCGRPWRHATNGALRTTVVVASITIVAIVTFAIGRNTPWGEFLRPT